MGSKSTRDHIVEEADRLFYQQGFEHTSFAHIAEAVKISRGNFYYHFKSKDEILDAVIDLRLGNTQAMLDKWQVEGITAVDRIRKFIDMLLMNQTKIKRYGCPVGTLCSELGKLDHGSRGEAVKLFGLFRAWLRIQFEQLGHKTNADELAMHLLARSQGIATLASAFDDQRFIEQEVKQLYEWLSLHAKERALAK